MVVLFEESKVSDTVNEFRAFKSVGSYFWESVYWISPCAVLTVLVILMPSVVMVVLLGLSILYTMWSFSCQVTEESVLIIKDFGIQLRIKYRRGSEETKVSSDALLIVYFGSRSIVSRS